MASLFIGRARAVLGMVMHQGFLGGLSLSHRLVQDANGVRYKCHDNGVHPVVEIDVRGINPDLLQDVVWAFVSNRGASNSVSVVNCNDGRIAKTITGLGPISAIAAAPDGRYVYVGTRLMGSGGVVVGYIIRIDVAGILAGFAGSAFGVAYNASFNTASLTVSRDGTKLYAYYQPSGPVGADNRGGFITLDTEDMSQLSNTPNDVAGPFVHATQAHGFLYANTLVPDPEGPGGTWQDQVPQVEVFAADLPSNARAAALELVDLRDDVAGGLTFMELRANRRGTRLYGASLRGTNVPTEGGEVDIPSFASMAIDDEGALSVVHLREFGDTTGCLAVAHSGARVYLADREGMAQVVDTADDADVIVQSFPYCDLPGSPPAYTHERGNRIHVGPASGIRPDNRIYYLSPQAYSLWAFDPGGDSPSMKVTLSTGADAFVLCKHGARLKASP